MKLLFMLPFLVLFNFNQPNQNSTDDFTVFMEVTTYQPDGYAAKDLATGEWIYTNRGQNFFENLPAGTYKFTAYEGHFCGASSEILTLSEANAIDGTFTVTLQGWCE
ncbi:hypothetical protein [Mesonia aestuariivivens]|uniref:Carboxypeptidase regulatory-like domain-containing protein n=1 Tax=Mesonia aestuariivivens TaxID=2796128 RepID=A0ABS6W5H1_9FLAO|nr:hypothetical protein [Mesonia aestuariivivens]MBW2962959.1 hypothetical protein [Mesonia aestuariivivens]